MKKICFDTTQAAECVGLFVNGAEMIPAGTLVNAMPVKHRNREYQRFSEEYDIRFIFEDDIPKVDFYTVPLVDIFAVDSAGGYIGSVGQPTDLEADIPICYIDSKMRCWLAAANGMEFLSNVRHWKQQLTAYPDIEFFESFEKAREKHYFVDRNELERKLKAAESQE